MAKRKIKQLMQKLALDEMSEENIAYALGVPLVEVRKVVADNDFRAPTKKDRQERKPKQEEDPRVELARSVNERNRKIRSEMKKGKTAEELAETYDLAESTINFICSGVKTEMIEQRNKVIRAERRGGSSLEELAEKYDLSQTYVKRICAGLNGPSGARASGKEKDKRDKEIREKYGKGTSATDLSKEYKLSKAYIYQICSGVKKKQNQKTRRETYFDYLRAQNPISLKKFKEKFNISSPYASKLMAEFVMASNQLVASGDIRLRTRDGNLEEFENTLVVQCGTEALFEEAVTERQIRF